MGERTGISWTDHTFNPWWGCMKVGPGCDNCYAAALDMRLGGGNHWGAGQPRKVFGDKHWNNPRRWDRAAQKAGERRRVFCASMADVFDNEAPAGLRERLWGLIRETPHLDWQLVTKRIGNAAKMLPDDWGDGYPNVWLLATVVNQEEADRDIPKLLETPARVRGLSIEPMLSRITLRWPSWGPGPINGRHDHLDGLRRLDWVIVGGESAQGGVHPRMMNPAWSREVRDQCVEAGVAFHMKQMTDRAPIPADLMIRQFPA